MAQYKTDSLSRVLNDTDKLMTNLKSFAQRRRDDMARGSVPAGTILDVYINLRSLRKVFSDTAAKTGIGQYAKDQKGDQTFDVVAAANDVILSIDNVNTWIKSNFPTHTAGEDKFLMERTLGDDGPIDRQFTSAQTAGLRTELDALISKIN